MSVIKLLVLRRLSSLLQDLNAFYVAQQTKEIRKVTVISFPSRDEEIKIKGCPPETENESICVPIIPHQEKH